MDTLANSKGPDVMKHNVEYEYFMIPISPVAFKDKYNIAILKDFKDLSPKYKHEYFTNRKFYLKSDSTKQIFYPMSFNCRKPFSSIRFGIFKILREPHWG